MTPMKPMRDATAKWTARPCTFPLSHSRFPPWSCTTCAREKRHQHKVVTPPPPERRPWHSSAEALGAAASRLPPSSALLPTPPANRIRRPLAEHPSPKSPSPDQRPSLHPASSHPQSRNSHSTGEHCSIMGERWSNVLDSGELAWAKGMCGLWLRYP